MEYEKDMTGVLFVNNDKKTENHPNLKGRIIINGEKYWLSAWTKESDKAGKYLTLSATKAEKKKTVQDRINEDAVF